VVLTERCYAIATALEEPWCEATLERLTHAGPHLATDGTTGQSPVPASAS